MTEGLSPFTAEELEQGDILPEKIASIAHDVDISEGRRLDHMLRLSSEVSDELKKRTALRFALRGSVAMYVLLNELRDIDSAKELMVLEQRISGGKNDFDVSVPPESVSSLMEDLHFSDDDKTKQRSVISLKSGRAMVDVLGRAELPGLPWVDVRVGNTLVPVVGAMEGIFERMSILAEPPTENGKPIERQVKWGVDIKILKAYLMIKNGWSETQLDTELAQGWDTYQQDIRYSGVKPIVDRFRGGEPAEDIIREALGSKGEGPVEDAGIAVRKLIPDIEDTLLQSLTHPRDADDFGQALRRVMDIIRPSSDYTEVEATAETEYSKLLQPPSS